MAKNKVSEWSATAVNNTDIGGINIAEGCAPSGINNAIRELMAQVKDMQAGSDSDGFIVAGTFTSSGGAVFSSTVALGSSATATTQTSTDSSTKVATTEFVQNVKTSGFADGTVSAPSIAFADDTNTGIYSPGANQLAVTTDGVQRVNFDSANMNMASTTNLQKNGNAAFTLKNVTYLTSGTAATYTTPTGVRALKVTVVGGGGGGGGVDGQGSNTYAIASGGAGGGWAEALITSVESSYTYTVGSGGNGGAAGNNNGSAGDSSEFKNSGSTVVISATGGSGGLGDTGGTSTSSFGVNGGIGSLTGITGTIAAGIASTFSRVISGSNAAFSNSGGSKFGGGQMASQPGAAARVYGEGGGAAYVGGLATNYAGGNGYQGVIIIEEYY